MRSSIVIVLFVFFLTPAVSQAKDNDSAERTRLADSIKADKEQLHAYISKIQGEKLTLKTLVANFKKATKSRNITPECKEQNVVDAASAAKAKLPYSDEGMRRWKSIMDNFDKQSKEFKYKCSDTQVREMLSDIANSIGAIDKGMSEAHRAQESINSQQTQLKALK